MQIRAVAMTVVVAALMMAHSGKVDAQTTAPAAQAAPPNACTGLAEAACPTVSGCVWLPGYKVKGAADVPGYCRTAPKPLSSRRQG